MPRIALACPLPDFAGNELTASGIGDVVQFARTQGCEATLIDLSKNQLDDAAALNELTRLVKNYGTFGSQSFISELLLSSNKIGKAGGVHPPSVGAGQVGAGQVGAVSLRSWRVAH